MSASILQRCYPSMSQSTVLPKAKCDIRTRQSERVCRTPQNGHNIMRRTYLEASDMSSLDWMPPLGSLRRCVLKSRPVAFLHSRSFCDGTHNQCWQTKKKRMQIKSCKLCFPTMRRKSHVSCSMEWKESETSKG